MGCVHITVSIRGARVQKKLQGEEVAGWRSLHTGRSDWHSHVWRTSQINQELTHQQTRRWLRTERIAEKLTEARCKIYELAQALKTEKQKTPISMNCNGLFYKHSVFSKLARVQE